MPYVRSGGSGRRYIAEQIATAPTAGLRGLSERAKAREFRSSGRGGCNRVRSMSACRNPRTSHNARMKKGART
jgi:hypothetical protein